MTIVYLFSEGSGTSEGSNSNELRPINMDDLEEALKSIEGSKINYLTQLSDIKID